MSDMKPCPFCGQVPTESQYERQSLFSSQVVVWHRVYCPHCDIGMNGEDYESLTNTWNRRYFEAENARLRALLRRVIADNPYDECRLPHTLIAEIKTAVS